MRSRLGICGALLLVACTIGSPTLTIPLGTNDFGGFALLVYDSSGLVTASRSNGRSEGAGRIEAMALPESREVVVSWTGGACSHAPTLAVKGDISGLHLALHSPPDGQIPFLPIACPAVGILFSVTLTLSQPVEQGALSIEDELSPQLDEPPR